MTLQEVRTYLQTLYSSSSDSSEASYKKRDCPSEGFAFSNNFCCINNNGINNKYHHAKSFGSNNSNNRQVSCLVRNVTLRLNTLAIRWQGLKSQLSSST